ncbi:MAG: hypothetical protein WCU74_04180 [Candidatus Omnitrophota bacterium]
MKLPFFPLKKTLSIFVTVAFVLTNHFSGYLYAQVPAMNESADARKTFPADLRDLRIPEKMGSVEDVFSGKTSRAVVLIQDAHAVPAAQASISALIGYLGNEYGLTQVALEGAADELDAEIFRTYPDKKALKQVFKTYHDRGNLAGGVAAAIFSGNNGTRPGASEAKFFGMDDWELYQEGVGHYLAAMKAQKAIGERLKNEHEKLNGEKQKNYPERLMAIDLAVGRFEDNQADLLEVLKQLAAVKSPAKGSELEVLVQQMRLDQQETATYAKGAAKDGGQNDASATDVEIRRIAKQVKRHLQGKKGEAKGAKGDSPRNAFNQKFQEYQTSKIAPEAFALFLRELVVRYKLPVKVSKVLGEKVRRQKRVEDIQGTKLFDDFEKYAEEVKTSLFENAQQRELNKRSRGLRLLDRFNKLELTHEDWESLKGDSPRVGFDAEFAPHLAFYENAIRRDHALFSNLSRRLDGRGDSSRALVAVAGGFHTRGLTRLLKENGISYVLLMPAIKEIPEETSYRDQMLGNVPWKDYFEVVDGKISLYNAFVRSTRDRLLAQMGAGNPDGFIPDDGVTLKYWRDEILRDLAAKNRLAEAERYTRFIDEATPQGRQREARRKRIMEKVEGFIGGLRGLRDTNRLTEPNILNLLKPAAIPTPGDTAVLARLEIRAGYVPALEQAVPATAVAAPITESIKKPAAAPVAPALSEQVLSEAQGGLLKAVTALLEENPPAAGEKVALDEIVKGLKADETLLGNPVADALIRFHDLLSTLARGEKPEGVQDFQGLSQSFEIYQKAVSELDKDPRIDVGAEGSTGIPGLLKQVISASTGIFSSKMIGEITAATMIPDMKSSSFFKLPSYSEIVRPMASFAKLLKGEPSEVLQVAPAGIVPPVPPIIPPNMDGLIREYAESQEMRIRLMVAKGEKTGEEDPEVATAIAEINDDLSKAMGLAPSADQAGPVAPLSPAMGTVFATAALQMDALKNEIKEKIDDLKADGAATGFWGAIFGFFQSLFLRLFKLLVRAQVNAEGALSQAILRRLASPVTWLFRRAPLLFGVSRAHGNQFLEAFANIQRASESLSRLAILKMLFGFLAKEVGESRKLILELIVKTIQDPATFDLKTALARLLREIIARRAAEKKEGVSAKIQKQLDRGMMKLFEGKGGLAAYLGLILAVGLAVVVHILARDPAMLKYLDHSEAWGLGIELLLFAVGTGESAVKFLNTELLGKVWDWVRKGLAKSRFKGLDLSKKKDELSALDQVRLKKLDGMMWGLKLVVTTALTSAGLAILTLVPGGILAKAAVGGVIWAGLKIHDWVKKRAEARAAAETSAGTNAVASEGSGVLAGFGRFIGASLGVGGPAASFVPSRGEMREMAGPQISEETAARTQAVLEAKDLDALMRLAWDWGMKNASGTGFDTIIDYLRKDLDGTLSEAFKKDDAKAVGPIMQRVTSTYGLRERVRELLEAQMRTDLIGEEQTMESLIGLLTNWESVKGRSGEEWVERIATLTADSALSRAFLENTSAVIDEKMRLVTSAYGLREKVRALLADVVASKLERGVFLAIDPRKPDTIVYLNPKNRRVELPSWKQLKDLTVEHPELAAFARPEMRKTGAEAAAVAETAATAERLAEVGRDLYRDGSALLGKETAAVPELARARRQLTDLISQMGKLDESSKRRLWGTEARRGIVRDLIMMKGRLGKRVEALKAAEKKFAEEMTQLKKDKVTGGKSFFSWLVKQGDPQVKVALSAYMKMIYNLYHVHRQLTAKRLKALSEEGLQKAQAYVERRVAVFGAARYPKAIESTGILSVAQRDLAAIRAELQERKRQKDAAAETKVVVATGDTVVGMPQAAEAVPTVIRPQTLDQTIGDIRQRVEDKIGGLEAETMVEQIAVAQRAQSLPAAAVNAMQAFGELVGGREDDPVPDRVPASWRDLLGNIQRAWLSTATLTAFEEDTRKALDLQRAPPTEEDLVFRDEGYAQGLEEILRDIEAYRRLSEEKGEWWVFAPQAVRLAILIAQDAVGSEGASSKYSAVMAALENPDSSLFEVQEALRFVESDFNLLSAKGGETVQGPDAFASEYVHLRGKMPGETLKDPAAVLAAVHAAVGRLGERFPAVVRAEARSEERFKAEIGLNFTVDELRSLLIHSLTTDPDLAAIDLSDTQVKYNRFTQDYLDRNPDDVSLFLLGPTGVVPQDRILQEMIRADEARQLTQDLLAVGNEIVNQYTGTLRRIIGRTPEGQFIVSVHERPAGQALPSADGQVVIKDAADLMKYLRHQGLKDGKVVRPYQIVRLSTRSPRNIYLPEAQNALPQMEAALPGSNLAGVGLSPDLLPLAAEFRNELLTNVGIDELREVLMARVMQFHDEGTGNAIRIDPDAPVSNFNRVYGQFLDAHAQGADADFFLTDARGIEPSTRVVQLVIREQEERSLGADMLAIGNEVVNKKSGTIRRVIGRQADGRLQVAIYRVDPSTHLPEVQGEVTQMTAKQLMAYASDKRYTVRRLSDRSLQNVYARAEARGDFALANLRQELPGEMEKLGKEPARQSAEALIQYLVSKLGRESEGKFVLTDRGREGYRLAFDIVGTGPAGQITLSLRQRGQPGEQQSQMPKILYVNGTPVYRLTPDERGTWLKPRVVQDYTKLDPAETLSNWARENFARPEMRNLQQVVSQIEARLSGLNQDSSMIDKMPVETAVSALKDGILLSFQKLVSDIKKWLDEAGGERTVPVEVAGETIRVSKAFVALNGAAALHSVGHRYALVQELLKARELELKVKEAATVAGRKYHDVDNHLIERSRPGDLRIAWGPEALDANTVIGHVTSYVGLMKMAFGLGMINMGSFIYHGEGGNTIIREQPGVVSFLFSDQVIMPERRRLFEASPTTTVNFSKQNGVEGAYGSDITNDRLSLADLVPLSKKHVWQTALNLFSLPEGDLRQLMADYGIDLNGNELTVAPILNALYGDWQTLTGHLAELGYSGESQLEADLQQLQTGPFANLEAFRKAFESVLRAEARETTLSEGLMKIKMSRMDAATLRSFQAGLAAKVEWHTAAQSSMSLQDFRGARLDLARGRVIASNQRQGFFESPDANEALEEILYDTWSQGKTRQPAETRSALVQAALSYRKEAPVKAQVRPKFRLGALMKAALSYGKAVPAKAQVAVPAAPAVTPTAPQAVQPGLTAEAAAVQIGMSGVNVGRVAFARGSERLALTEDYAAQISGSFDAETASSEGAVPAVVVASKPRESLSHMATQATNKPVEWATIKIALRPSGEVAGILVTELQKNPAWRDGSNPSVTPPYLREVYLISKTPAGDFEYAMEGSAFSPYGGGDRSYQFGMAEPLPVDEAPRPAWNALYEKMISSPQIVEARAEARAIDLTPFAVPRLKAMPDRDYVESSTAAAAGHVFLNSRGDYDGKAGSYIQIASDGERLVGRLVARNLTDDGDVFKAAEGESGTWGKVALSDAVIKSFQLYRVPGTMIPDLLRDAKDLRSARPEAREKEDAVAAAAVATEAGREAGPMLVGYLEVPDAEAGQAVAKLIFQGALADFPTLVEALLGAVRQTLTASPSVAEAAVPEAEAQVAVTAQDYQRLTDTVLQTFAKIIADTLLEKPDKGGAILSVEIPLMADEAASESFAAILQQALETFGTERVKAFVPFTPGRAKVTPAVQNVLEAVGISGEQLEVPTRKASALDGVAARRDERAACLVKNDDAQLAGKFSGVAVGRTAQDYQPGAFNAQDQVMSLVIQMAIGAAAISTLSDQEIADLNEARRGIKKLSDTQVSRIKEKLEAALLKQDTFLYGMGLDNLLSGIGNGNLTFVMAAIAKVMVAARAEARAKVSA